jgi:hypothetical protein
MAVLIERCAGLDVHIDLDVDNVMACVRIPGEGEERRQEIHEFATPPR